MSYQIFNRFKPVLLISSLLILLSGCQDTSSNNIYGYDFNSARITYQISGSSSGSSTVIIKGEKKVIKNNIVQTRPDGTKVEVNTYIIQNGDKQYTLDIKTNTGSIITNPLYAQLKALTSEQRKDRLIKEIIQNKDETTPKPETQEQIAGQKCDVYSGSITKTCLWQGIPLKTIASLPDYGINTQTIATKIELNPTISDSEFDVPSDYQITAIK
jgi:hypothetical protein